VREDHPVIDLLTTDYTFLNERMAQHYENQGHLRRRIRRVKIRGPQSVRPLGTGEHLAVTSYPNRTAPTIRGKLGLGAASGHAAAAAAANVHR